MLIFGSIVHCIASNIIIRIRIAFKISLKKKSKIVKPTALTASDFHIIQDYQSQLLINTHEILQHIFTNYQHPYFFTRLLTKSVVSMTMIPRLHSFSFSFLSLISTKTIQSRWRNVKKTSIIMPPSVPLISLGLI